MYTVEMHHDENSFTALSKMQYDLFCGNNKITRSILSFGILIFAVSHLNEWWAYLLVIYAIYLTSSTRMTATRAARKLKERLEKSGMSYPASRLRFENDALYILGLPERAEEEEAVLPYGSVSRIAEDATYFYVFRDSYGGYMVPKAALKGQEDVFRSFLEHKLQKTCYAGASPLSRLVSLVRRKRESGGGR
ncbi:MAG: YcxB family protein [Oscillospiraceae bacterium]|nr:YcxB family protein [Oscillospiraceae bacterium]